MDSRVGGTRLVEIGHELHRLDGFRVVEDHVLLGILDAGVERPEQRPSGHARIEFPEESDAGLHPVLLQDLCAVGLQVAPGPRAVALADHRPEGLAVVPGVDGPAVAEAIEFLGEGVVGTPGGDRNLLAEALARCNVPDPPAAGFRGGFGDTARTRVRRRRSCLSAIITTDRRDPSGSIEEEADGSLRKGDPTCWPEN
jgi:hypothetical protein